MKVFVAEGIIISGHIYKYHSQLILQLKEVAALEEAMKDLKEERTEIGIWSGRTSSATIGGC